MSFKWAENEVRIACERERKASGSIADEWFYGCACYESALKAYKSLAEDDHSVFSWSLTKNILIRLMNDKPLTPIEDTDDVWKYCWTSDVDGSDKYQCKRMSGLFKTVYNDGRVEYKDIDAVDFIDVNSPNCSYYNSSLHSRIKDLFPITMPYYPTEKPIKVYTEDFLVDPTLGDYNTKGILYAIKPDGERIEINRYFKFDEKNDVKEIDEEEYNQRKEFACVTKE